MGKLPHVLATGRTVHLTPARFLWYLRSLFGAAALLHDHLPVYLFES